MDWRRAGAPEEERRAPARARGAEDGGGPPAPPLLKVRSRCSTKNLKN